MSISPEVARELEIRRAAVKVLYDTGRNVEKIAELLEISWNVANYDIWLLRTRSLIGFRPSKTKPCPECYQGRIPTENEVCKICKRAEERRDNLRRERRRRRWRSEEHTSELQSHVNL